MASVTGLVLAGGSGRRMGGDKATLVVDGERLVDRAVARLSQVADDVLVASGDGRRLTGLAVPQVADPVPGAGPLGAILAGLVRARTATVAVVAVDLPDVDVEVLRHLAGRWDGEVATVPQVGGRLQVLHAIWSVAASDELGGAFDAGERSPRRFLTGRDLRVVTEPELAAAGLASRFARDLDTPGDLAARRSQR